MGSEFPGDSTVEMLLPLFYRKYDLDSDGGLSDSSVKIVFYKNICIYLPNIADRKKAVLKHDIHHIITGYRSDFKGETEIGAWEIASGCHQYWVALALDLPAMLLGALFNLPDVFRAFVKGKRTKNLYNDLIPDKDAVKMTVNDLREKLMLNNYIEGNPTFMEVSSFIYWCLLGGVYSILSVIFLPFVIVYTIIIALRKH